MLLKHCAHASVTLWIWDDPLQHPKYRTTWTTIHTLQNKKMSRRSLRTGEGESVTSRLPGQDATSRCRREMEAASSVCSRLCYCGNVVKTHTSWTVSHPGRRFQVCARVSFSWHVGIVCIPNLMLAVFVWKHCFRFCRGMDVHFGNGLTQRCVTDRSTSFQACLGK